MDQDNPSQISQKQEDDPNEAAEALTKSQTSAPATASPAAQPGRPRRPQRSTRVEGSVDISEPRAEPQTEPKAEPQAEPRAEPKAEPRAEPKAEPRAEPKAEPRAEPKAEPRAEPRAEPKAEPTPVADQDESTPDGPVASRPKPSRPGTVKPSGERIGPKVGPKGPGHHPVRAASVPHPVASHQNLHAQRALSVAGTADTPQAQTVEDFRLHIITWNVGSATPPDDITSLLGLNVGDGNTDMYIIGLQEVNSMINKRLKDVLFTDQWSEVCMERLSPFGYVLVTSQRMQGCLLLVFAKYFHLPFLRGVQTETTRTGLGGYWGNKGGVSARMSVFGHTICFLNCHLPAHMENSEQRMEDFESILQQQQFEGQAATGVLDHDVVFWFGDLNFRIDVLDMQVVKSAIDNNKYQMLLEKDQLNMAKDSETVLEGFQEGALKFPPTYKFDVGTDTYDTSGKKRKPAWTDRILWRLRATAGSALNAGKRGSMLGLTSGTKVTQHYYRSYMEYTVSDHKPVSSIFTLQFPYKVDIPLVTIMVEDEWNSPGTGWDSTRWVSSTIRIVGYVWAKQEEADFTRPEHQVTFTEEELPKGSGDFILGYYSNNMSTIVGVTEPFQIQLPTSGLDASSSDSSDFSSEDESTRRMSESTRPPAEGSSSNQVSASGEKEKDSEGSGV
ncbi:Phosphatidylinositol 45-bisphosphate 5-phosphatase A [Dissostichus eleginoides]|uniref:Phosphatidylinositol 4,5-bisphosphate 5-phosphatase A n=1 Tax=Dissostichus eleginoides TaxID=100907 RepID=A0AAD9BXZ4_DISEL|nr:Phosphatidylinositol 45-bisphosphate 5-phosphatase A [Dissostichus eleginoides]